MKRYVAFLRGINISGKNKVPMAELKKAFEELGFREVKTYLNSGNVIFSSDDENIGSLTSRIETMIKEQFGDKIVIHGGITASELVGQAVTHEELVKGVQECVDICAPGGNFIVMLSECEYRAQEVSEAFRVALNKAGWEYR